MPTKLKTLSLETIINELDFLEKKSYCSLKRLKKEILLLLASKLIDNIPDLLNAKEHYESFWRQEKSVKQSEIITYQPNIFRNPNIVDINSDIIEHPNTSHKLSKTIRRSEKIDSDTLYIVTQKVQIFWTKKKVKITKWAHLKDMKVLIMLKFFI